jgi:hypothetical protein
MVQFRIKEQSGRNRLQTGFCQARREPAAMGFFPASGEPAQTGFCRARREPAPTDSYPASKGQGQMDFFPVREPAAEVLFKAETWETNNDEWTPNWHEQQSIRPDVQ